MYFQGKFFFYKKSTNFSGLPQGLPNTRTLGRAKLAKALAPGLTRRANALQLRLGGGGGGGWTQLELTDALSKKISANVVSVEIHQQEGNISLYFILYFKHSSRLALCGKITNQD